MDRLGICLDTAHLWGAGYDIADQDGVDALVQRIDEILGRERVVMLHLNDSRDDCSAPGSIATSTSARASSAARACASCSTHPWLATLPTFLETPGMDIGYDEVNLERVPAWSSTGERLPDLPPEAFTHAQSRRSRSQALKLGPEPPVVRERDRTKGLYRATHAHRNMPLSRTKRPFRWPKRHSANGERRVR